MKECCKEHLKKTYPFGNEPLGMYCDMSYYESESRTCPSCYTKWWRFKLKGKTSYGKWKDYCPPPKPIKFIIKGLVDKYL